jgi:hypothetical protein
MRAREWSTAHGGGLHRDALKIAPTFVPPAKFRKLAGKEIAQLKAL